MSRWISLGLRTGVRTTRFPNHEDLEVEAAPSAVVIDPGRLTPEEALSAAAACPTDALRTEGDPAMGTLEVDLGQCVMCGRCVRAAPAAFRHRSDPRVAVRTRRRLTAAVSWQGGRVEVVEAPGRDPDAAVEPDPRSARAFRRSLHIRHVDAGSSNATESELQLLSSPYYDLQRLGLFFTPTPRHADALLVTGVVTRQMETALLETYEAMPAPKLVIAAGVCAIGGGLFADGLMTRGPLDRLLPVDVYVPGSPPAPAALLHGLLLAAGKAEERLNVLERQDGA
jgi:formate hydrogenlyase subunit 7